MEIITHSNKDTQRFGMLLGKRAFPSMIIALSGEVGAGKTEFAKGFTVGANSDVATSPTFAIMNVYQGEKIPVYHFDFYRCGGEYEEFEEYIFGEGASLIEWSEYLDLPKDILSINIEKLDNNSRKFICTAGNKVYEDILKEVFREFTGG